MSISQKFQNRHYKSSDHKFDRVTGQIFTETIINVQTGDDRSWLYQPVDQPYAMVHFGSSSNSMDFKKTPKNSKVKGTQSLLLTALEKIISNVPELNDELIGILPISLVELLWKTLSERSLISFHVWSIFSVRLNRDKSSARGSKMFRQNILAPKSQISTYTRALTNNMFEFITVLSITIPFSVSDLVQLSKLVNLVALEVINFSNPKQSFISDFIIRAWSLSASKKNGFQILRILRLWDHEEITPKSLAYLDDFPALAIYDVRGCSFDHYKTQKGSAWKYKGACDPITSLYNEYHERPNCLLDFIKKLHKLTKKDLNQINWDFKLIILTEIIGKFSDNSDFRKAGVLSRSRIISLDDEISLVPNLVPIASLRLGPPHYNTYKSSWFLREKFSKQENSALSEIFSDQTAGISEPKVSSLKDKKPPLNRKSKRKLNDVLKEFF